MAVAPNNGVMAGTVGFHRSSPGRNASTTSTANMAGSPTRPSTKLPVNSVVETKILNALPMPSELFYVIGENAPMIAMSRPQRRHRDGKKGRTGVKWQWKQFENPAREDGLQLSHWERDSASDAADQSMALDTTNEAGASTQEYSFARYNTTTNVYSYSSDEYVSHLRDESGNWSREETDYLFALCHRYDLRWFVIKDRWDFDNYTSSEEIATSTEEAKPEATSAPANGTSSQELPEGNASTSDAIVEEKDTDEKPDQVNGEATTSTPDAAASIATPAGPFAAPSAPEAPSAEAVQPVPDESEAKKERTIEELKDRYYSVCRRLIRARPASDENAKQALLQSYAFDKDREAARKHHIQNVLMQRTPQQLEEEEFLYVESRRLEQQYNKISRDREELWRTLCGVGPQSTSVLALNSPFLSAAAKENAANAAGLSNKKRRRGELDMLEDPNNTGTKVADPSALPQLTPAQDEQYGITRFDASTPASSVIRPSGVYLRSAKPPQLKTSLAPKITSALQEQNISMRLAMPTRQNMEKLEALVNAITSLLDCKKQVERAEYEVKVLKTRKDAAMRIDEEDKAIKAHEEEEARKQKEKENSAMPSGDGMTPQGETSSAASSMQVDT